MACQLLILARTLRLEVTAAPTATAVTAAATAALDLLAAVTVAAEIVETGMP
jgi:hypothetical protein